MNHKTWLVTGSADGLGRAVAEAVLTSGDRLVATARGNKLAQLEDLQARYPQQLVLAALDVTDAVAAQAAVDLALAKFGRLDVLVNNAGFSITAAFEQASALHFDAQIATNFFGVVHTMRAAVPVMRAQRAGHIINISSAAGRIGMPGQAAYCAAKFAVGGLSEAVAAEVASFGVKVIAVEPGSMRSNFGTSTIKHGTVPDPDYIASVGAFLATLQAINGREMGDIGKVAKVVLELASRDQLPLHLIVGSDALTLIGAADRQRAELGQAWAAASRAVDADDADLSWLASASPH